MLYTKHHDDFVKYMSQCKCSVNDDIFPAVVQECFYIYLNIQQTVFTATLQLSNVVLVNQN